MILMLRGKKTLTFIFLQTLNSTVSLKLWGGGTHVLTLWLMRQGESEIHFYQEWIN